jgi:hypothetical protein
LERIRKVGLRRWLDEQTQKQTMLEAALDEFDDGRSRSFCCNAASLLPTRRLMAVLSRTRKTVEQLGLPESDRKGRAKLLRQAVEQLAAARAVSLRLRRPAGQLQNGQ